MVILLYLYFSEIFLKSDFNYNCVIYIIVICLIDYLSRKYITNAFIFFTLRFLCIPAIILATRDSIEITMLIIISISFFLFFVNFWKSEGSDKRLFAIDMPLEAIVLFIGIFFHASINMSSSLTTFAYLSGIAYILLHFLRLYLDRFIMVSINLEDNQSSLTNTFRMNSTLITIFLLIIILFIFLLNIVLDNDNFNFIGRFLKFIATLIFGFLSRFKNDGVVYEEQTQLESETGIGNTITSPSKNPTINETPNNPIADTLFNLLQIAIYIAIVLAIIFMVYMFFKNYMYRNRETDDEVKPLDVVQKLDKTEQKKNGRFHIFLSNREKIRKIYRTTISNRMKNNSQIRINRSNTPNEIHSTIQKQSNNPETDLKSLTSIYEKARYSNHDITSEDVESTKALKN